jgi:hypothetical protein
MTEQTFTVIVPFAIRKRGGRKLILSPDGARWSQPRARIDNTLVKAVARAHRWKQMLESGEYATINELAKHERITAPFLTRTLRLMQLAPDLVESILDGSQPQGLTLEALRNPLPPAWSEQRRHLFALSRNSEIL